MNIVAGPKRENGEGGLGCECCGVVTRVGPEVKDLKVGDRVISIAPGSFATTLTASEKLCAKMPDQLSFLEGATIPCVYGTVIYSLIDLARLERGQVGVITVIITVEMYILTRNLADCPHSLRVWRSRACNNPNRKNGWG
jgi:NADPH:quinone reductase-like Zn-dependent oxidoreductase